MKVCPGLADWEAGESERVAAEAKAGIKADNAKMYVSFFMRLLYNTFKLLNKSLNLPLLISSHPVPVQYGKVKRIHRAVLIDIGGRIIRKPNSVHNGEVY